MKQIINGKTYNTHTARCVRAEYEHGHSLAFTGRINQAYHLFQTRRGDHFIVATFGNLEANGGGRIAWVGDVSRTIIPIPRENNNTSLSDLYKYGAES